MADIQRDESFRTAIKNQKRRLSATKIEKRNSITETGQEIWINMGYYHFRGR